MKNPGRGNRSIQFLGRVLFFLVLAAGKFFSQAPAAFVTVGGPGAGTAGDVFNPTAVTITQGQSVEWIYSSGFHTVNVDNGTGTGTCSDYNFEGVAAGTEFTQVFSVGGTFPFHCDVHSSCVPPGAPCSIVCTGLMVGQ